MLVQKSISKKKTFFLLSILSLTFLIISILLYKTFLADKFVSEINVSEGKIISLEQIKSDLSFDILSDSKFLSLKESKELPLQVKAKGKLNPFERF